MMAAASMSTDITEKREAELRARRIGEERSLLLDTMDTQVWYLKDIDTYGLVNRAHAEFLGYRPEQIEHQPIESFLPPEDAAIARDSNRQVFLSKETVRSEEWMSDVDGTPRLLSITKTPAITSEGEIDYVVRVAVDVTSIRESEDELIKLTNLVLQSDDSIVETDRFGRISYANPAVERMFGHPLQGIRGEAVLRLLDEDSADVDVAGIA